MQHVMHLNSDAWPPLGAPPPQNGRHLQGAMQTPTALPEPAASKSGPSLGFYNVWNGRSSDVWTPSPGLHPSLPSKPLPASFISASAFAASDPTRMPEQGAFAHLDRFAPIYVPLWMRQIAAAEPACIVKHPDQPIQNGHAFAKAIFPKTLYEAIREERLVAEKSVLSTINLELEKLEKLDNSHIEPRYASKLFSLQIKEFEARKLDLVASTLYNVEVSRATLDDGGPYNLLKLEAPEIREGYPMLDVNDIVFLRHLRNSPQGVTWDGIVYLATVRNIKRSQAMVLIQCNPLNEVVSDTPERFIVGFEPQGECAVSVYGHVEEA